MISMRKQVLRVSILTLTLIGSSGWIQEQTVFITDAPRGTTPTAASQSASAASADLASPSGNPILKSNNQTLDGILNDPWVIKESGSAPYVMYYGAIKGDFSDPKVRIFRITSSDGKQWTRQGKLVLSPGSTGTWDALKVETPAVVKLPDNSYRLYYSGGNNPKGEVFQIGMATSRDGITWEKYAGNPVLSLGPRESFDSYSVMNPSVIHKDDQYWLWYVGISDTTYQAQIGLATSRDGISWEKHGVVLTLGVERKGSSDAGVTEPHVIWNGRAFEMFYAVLQEEGQLVGPLWHAVSPDGRQWQKDTTPFLEIGDAQHWTAQGVHSPSVLFENGQYQLWYGGTRTDKKSYVETGIGYRVWSDPQGRGPSHQSAPTQSSSRTAPAQSASPAHQAKPGQWVSVSKEPILRSNPELDGLLDDPWVIKESGASGQYIMYYGAAKGDFSDPTGRIFRATSKDRIRWVRDAKPVLSPGGPDSWDVAQAAAPSVIRLPDNTYRMYYTGGKEPNSVKFQVGMATSLDGVTWTKHKGNPVLPFGPKGSFDEFSVLEPSILHKDGRYWLWYVGISNLFQAQIGLATSANGIQWEKHGVVLTFDVERRNKDGAGVTKPHVIWNGKAFELFYAVLQKEGQLLGPLWHAVSTDGRQWQKDPTPLLEIGDAQHWTAQGISAPSVLLENGTYHLWYSGTRTDGKTYFELGIGYAMKPGS